MLTLERLLSRVSEGRRPSLRVSELATLNQIDLDGEKLSSIPGDVVASIPSATRLFLQNNSLTDVSFLKPLSRLRYLNLAGNKLQKVTFLCCSLLSPGPSLTAQTCISTFARGLTKSVKKLFKFQWERWHMQAQNSDNGPVQEPGLVFEQSARRAPAYGDLLVGQRTGRHGKPCRAESHKQQH